MEVVCAGVLEQAHLWDVALGGIVQCGLHEAPADPATLEGGVDTDRSKAGDGVGEDHKIRAGQLALDPRGDLEAGQALDEPGLWRPIPRWGSRVRIRVPPRFGGKLQNRCVRASRVCSRGDEKVDSIHARDLSS